MIFVELSYAHLPVTPQRSTQFLSKCFDWFDRHSSYHIVSSKAVVYSQYYNFLLSVYSICGNGLDRIQKAVSGFQSLWQWLMIMARMSCVCIL